MWTKPIDGTKQVPVDQCRAGRVGRMRCSPHMFIGRLVRGTEQVFRTLQLQYDDDSP